MALITAVDWNADAALLAKAWPISGGNCSVDYLDDGIILSGEGSAFWEHPWQVSATYEFLGQEQGEWRAQIRPGFVNGRDAYLAMRANWSVKGAPAGDVPLTDELAPYLVLKDWRNPLLPSSISASAEGEIVYGAGEGYPPFFEQLGVRLPAKGGPAGKIGADAGVDDPHRTREIRAIDLVLNQPRIGTRLEVRIGDPVVEGQTQFLDTVFVNDYVRATGGRARIRAVPKFIPLGEQSTEGIFGTLLNAADPQFDEVRLATVWIVSPPGAGTDAEPDHTWAIYPQHRHFWNLCHAPKIAQPLHPIDPLKLIVPLAAGAGQSVINGLLSTINDNFAESLAFLTQARSEGKFWSI